MTRSGWLLAIAAACFAAVGAALITQHTFDMQPCPWCVLQRLIFILIGLVALLGLVWRGALGQRVVLLALVLLSGSGIAAALWQQFVAKASASCNLTLADRIVSGLRLDALLPDVFQATASCADAAVDLAGVPYEFWSLALFLLIEAASVGIYLRGRRAAAPPG